ncbi:GlcG/HbpS family heme-binding protein [Catenulispora pinisilvae]|uniref:GlcG/HbpS family heme-binding protein n=1 Tax=Catenulispora pinisilvae TaxID=2705253 RepID=UPI001891AF3D|nr:heme-binding protein [Catenulispora pinisilvae]
MNITLSQAEAVIAAARARAGERGLAVAFAVVDAGGNLVAFARADGANLITIDTAIGKAFTAVSIGGDSGNLAPAIQPGGPLFGTGLVLAGARSLVPYGGGVLIRVEGRVIGALGVSGAPGSDDDHQIAAAATTA